MKIAHIDTERTWRGGEQQVFYLAQGLEKKGHQNLLVVRRGSALEERCVNQKWTMVPIRPFGELDFINAHFLNRLFKKEKVDVVHAHTGHAVAIAAFATFGTQIPIVATRRVDFPLSDNFFSKIKHRRVSRFIAISEKVNQVLIESGIPESKIRLVKSGVDFNRFQNVKKVDRRELGVNDDSIIIGQVAALAPHKDQETLLRAFHLLLKKNPKVVLVLIGDGDKKEFLKKLVVDLDIQNKVHFLGFKENSISYLASFDIFCLSSNAEGLGTSILDAMGVRVPVVATRAGGISEIIQDGVTGYLSAPSDPAELSRILEKAVLDQGKAKIIENAFKKAQEFDIQNTINGTESVYKEILGQ